MTKSKHGLTASEAERLLSLVPGSPALLAVLADGSWYAKGLRTLTPRPGFSAPSQQIPIDPNKHPEHLPAYLWDVLEIDSDDNTAWGGGLNYICLRFYEGDGNVDPPEPAEAEHRPLDKHRRSRDVGANALLENHINTVIAKAKNKWPDPQKCPGVNQMARMLVDGEPNKKVCGYSEQTIRQILMGIYKPARDRGIPGLSG